LQDILFCQSIQCFCKKPSYVIENLKFIIDNLLGDYDYDYSDLLFQFLKAFSSKKSKLRIILWKIYKSFKNPIIIISLKLPMPPEHIIDSEEDLKLMLSKTTDYQTKSHK